MTEPQSRKEQIYRNRELIFDEITRIVNDFLYWRRKGDPTLPVGMIERCIELEEITVNEIVKAFRADLVAGIRGE